MFFSCFPDHDADVNRLKSAAANGEDSEPWSHSLIRFSSVDEPNFNGMSSKVVDKRSIILRRASFNDSSIYQVGWVLNSESDCCLCCQNKFSLLRRRHHCRMCGDIVCDDCSQFRAVVEGLGHIPQRICIECHEIQIQKAIREQIYEQKTGKSYFSEQIFPNIENFEENNDSPKQSTEQVSKKLEKLNSVNDSSQNYQIPTTIRKEENQIITRNENTKNITFQSDVSQTLSIKKESETKKTVSEKNVSQKQIQNTEIQPQADIIVNKRVQSTARENFLFKSIENLESEETIEPVNNFDDSDDDDEVYPETPILDILQLPTQEIFLQGFPTIAQTAENDNIDDIVENVMEIVIEVISDITAVELIAMAEIELEEEEEKEKKKKYQQKTHQTPVSEHDETWNAISTKMGIKMKEYVINEVNQLRRDTTLVPSSNQLQSSTLDSMVNALLKASTNQRRLTV